MKTTIFFMRHGEVHNPKRVLYGRLPRYRLTPFGERKINKAAAQLKKEKIDYIYASPMLRARQTAGIISQKLGLRPKISKKLIEVKLVFEGMALAEYKTNIQPFLYSGKYYELGQETVEEIFRRMKQFLNSIIKKHKYAKILVISHGDPIAILKAGLTGSEFTWKYKRENYLKTGEYIKLTIEDKKYNFG